MDAPATERARRRVLVHGIVQGVGFRPFVYRLALQLGLAGWVRNDGAGVTIELQGTRPKLEEFARRLLADAPALARIDEVLTEPLTWLPGADDGFRIVESVGRGPATTAIGPDSALCADCLHELLDPADRRWRYPFINCTHCGPRFTITRQLPYDREMTSMAGFRQCPACLAEYRSPRDRRFHAEPNACPVCGPRLEWREHDGQIDDGVDPVAAALAAVQAGRIVAVKGLGGFHLVCDARQPDAVARLLQRKAREEKPFAVMAAGLASLRPLVEIEAAQAALLAGRERPIVLLRKSAQADRQLPGVAPGLAWLGVMLPYTPLQVLLFHEAAGRPPGTAWIDEPQPMVLVMTSANPGGEPLVIGNDEAVARLAGIADAWLMHDRDIVQRCDDSVLRGLAAAAAEVSAVPAGALAAPGVASGSAFPFIRRARGYTPRAIRLASAGPPTLALGGWYKNTACALRGQEAFMTPHIGDLDNAPSCRALDEAVAHLLHLLQLKPEIVAHDLHPDFYSSQLAARIAEASGARLLAVQHHHAHVAAVLAEHRFERPALGLALDGVGQGSDGLAWGGELLRVEGASFTRLGHLRPLRLPGGDRAAREPWRVAVAALVDAGRIDRAQACFGDEPALEGVLQLLQRGVHTPSTSSMGRWFDAAAAVLGVRRRIAFEGQAAMLLEGLADAHGPVTPEPDQVDWTADGPDFSPLLVQLVDESEPARGAARFHATVAWALARWARDAARGEGLDTVACGGGCMLNAIVTQSLQRHFAAAGLAMLNAVALPPNDGGLALGQAWVARQAPLDAD
jgi:hydrogenase maturation protein HypF